jgi:transposase
MKCIVELTEAERCTLQQLSSNHRHRDFRTRATGVLLLGNGQKVRDVAADLQVTCKSVYNWVHAWRNRGLCGLLAGHKGGRPPGLTQAMIITAIETAHARTATLAQIALTVETVHGCALPCRPQTLARALRRAGVCYKRARYSPKKEETGRTLSGLERSGPPG